MHHKITYDYNYIITVYIYITWYDMQLPSIVVPQLYIDSRLKPSHNLSVTSMLIPLLSRWRRTGSAGNVENTTIDSMDSCANSPHDFLPKKTKVSCKCCHLLKWRYPFNHPFECHFPWNKPSSYGGFPRKPRHLRWNAVKVPGDVPPM
jgi:hypothetical protein